MLKLEMVEIFLPLACGRLMKERSKISHNWAITKMKNENDKTENTCVA